MSDYIGVPVPHDGYVIVLDDVELDSEQVCEDLNTLLAAVKAAGPASMFKELENPLAKIDSQGDSLVTVQDILDLKAALAALPEHLKERV